MQSLSANRDLGVTSFAIEGMMLRYSIFIPRLYNFCKSLGFDPGKILPSRAFCSDENQGFPIILITKHFGTFPFNHGRVGGIVATDRSAPYAEHGKDLVIIQASHVGYDPDSELFGAYRRLQTEHSDTTSSCGKIDSVIGWYLSEYRFAQKNILLEKDGRSVFIIIDNQLLNNERNEGLFLKMEKMISANSSSPVGIYSTAKRFLIADTFLEMLNEVGVCIEKKQAIANNLTAPYFCFKRDVSGDTEDHGHLERNLLPVMSSVVTSKAPLLTAAVINTQIEFDRTFRTIVKTQGYRGKKVLLISGINIDISPKPGQLFPLTKFVPWAAYIQNSDGSGYTLEQDELLERLNAQTTDNPDQINLEDAINEMMAVKEIHIHFP